MRIRRLLFFGLCGLLAAQTPATFHISSRLIQVSVIVHDHKGEPVMGLDKDQFTLFDQGKTQRIAFFSEQASQPAQSPAAPIAPTTSGRTFSNRPVEGNTAPANITAILFDSLNTDFHDAAFARGRVDKFLHAIRPEDQVALYGLSSRLVVLHDFTDDQDALVKALARFKAGDTFEAGVTKFSESHGDPLFSGPINDTNQRVSDMYMGSRVQQTAAALESIARHLAGVPGRKNLVWVSGSFPVNIGYFQKRLQGTRPDKQAFGAEVDNAGRALSNSNIAIYPVDAHALTALGGVFNAATTPTLAYGQLHTRAAEPLPARPELDTMQTLAEATGGRVFLNTNDIEGAVRSAIDDSRGSYVLSYYPDHDQWDGKFREIKVQVKHPNVEVRYRRGYSAFPDIPLDPKRAPLTAADGSRGPLDSTELGLTIQVEPVVEGGVRLIKARLRFDTGGMQFEQKDGRWLDELDVLWVQSDADGKLVTSNGQTLTLKLSDQTYQTAIPNGVRMTSTEAIDEHAAQLRFVARDKGTGAIGSVKIPLKNVFP